jgi:two-component system cell cycle sensor histidine kinase/response regulator CckA
MTSGAELSDRLCHSRTCVRPVRKVQVLVDLPGPSALRYGTPKTSTMTETTLETILLVEDEPAVRQLFAQALKRAGYAVLEARNGQEAMKVFDQHGETIDMLLTDMRMPYMGGAELAHHLRGRRRSLKLLCISGYPGNLDAELAIDFLAKPFSRDDLLKKVREVLDK